MPLEIPQTIACSSVFVLYLTASNAVFIRILGAFFLGLVSFLFYVSDSSLTLVTLIGPEAAGDGDMPCPLCFPVSRTAALRTFRLFLQTTPRAHPFPQVFLWCLVRTIMWESTVAFYQDNSGARCSFTH